MEKKYPRTPEIRLWCDLALLDTYEEVLTEPDTGMIEQWQYRARLRTEILRRMRITNAKKA